MINGKERELPKNTTQKSSFVSFGEKGEISTYAKNVHLGYVFEMMGMQFNKDCLVTETKESFCNDGSKELRLLINGMQDYYYDGHVVGNGEEILIEYDNRKKVLIFFCMKKYEK